MWWFGTPVLRCIVVAGAWCVAWRLGTPVPWCSVVLVGAADSFVHRCYGCSGWLVFWFWVCGVLLCGFLRGLFIFGVMIYDVWCCSLVRLCRGWWYYVVFVGVWCVLCWLAALIRLLKCNAGKKRLQDGGTAQDIY